MIDKGPVLLDIDGGIARLRLNRPEAANGMSVEMLSALCDAIMACHGHPGLRVVLLSGEGTNFCGGGDVRAFASKGEKLPDYIRQATAYLQNAVTGLLRLEAPVIASVQGFAAGGGGFGLVCASDIVIAGESAKFLAGATRVAMAPDAGVSVTLSRLVGLRRAMSILLTNPVIPAAEALQMGIVTKVVPDGELADASMLLARELAAGAPKALAATKRLVWAGTGTSIEQCLSEEARTVSELSGMSDAREGLAAVIERRKPVFTGR
ncbi:enoyl-CoA hydratase/isomerase family protein [Bradyrhizobium sp. 147]|jgi:2-(1,2-epoxy-1,2-dihydrophenyl)acetyl-CoA isomerase|uniref:enoyl-CoA hydratase/isomerase family protein n=1 Tax=unclassified Bradyrhizobium TaxID=2631580 RepID=UPI001FFAD1F9|nr:MULTISPECIES: enoyl-CoA hydratase-related protein [unclassified Bradyrhizobium]MCK1624249.1 enoyl-CoA hydratase/isomerase family protein [Bradyrhizobium sp. 160]MCK1678888.1 enoyl-CoA hydratase/isomerase family protein [Bradyrhizobium sp. 147]